MANQVVNLLERERIRKANDIVQQKLKKEFVPEAVEWDDKIFVVVSRCVKGPQGWPGLCKLAILDEAQMKKAKAARKVVISGVYVNECVNHFEAALKDRMYKVKAK